MNERELDWKAVPSQCGHAPTECPKCGNRDINKILIWHDVAYPGHKIPGTDATPISTFLYERRPGAKLSNVPVTLEKLTCLKCAEEGRGEIEIPISPVGPYHD